MEEVKIVMAAWPGIWTRYHNRTDKAMEMELPDPFGDGDIPRVEVTCKNGEWLVTVCAGGDLVEVYGADLAETVRRAREETARELAPLLRAIGADLIIAALSREEVSDG
jgi:hypothetical protein